MSKRSKSKRGKFLNAFWAFMDNWTFSMCGGYVHMYVRSQAYFGNQRNLKFRNTLCWHLMSFNFGSNGLGGMKIYLFS